MPQLPQMANAVPGLSGHSKKSSDAMPWPQLTQGRTMVGLLAESGQARSEPGVRVHHHPYAAQCPGRGCRWVRRRACPQPCPTTHGSVTMSRLARPRTTLASGRDHQTNDPARLAARHDRQGQVVAQRPQHEFADLRLAAREHLVLAAVVEDEANKIAE